MTTVGIIEEAMRRLVERSGNLTCGGFPITILPGPVVEAASDAIVYGDLVKMERPKQHNDMTFKDWQRGVAKVFDSYKLVTAP